jgi:AcrR family transcriptional regulator
LLYLYGKEKALFTFFFSCKGEDVTMFVVKEKFEDKSCREEIINAARVLVLKKGIEMTTFAEIATEAGISEEILASHYASKNEILFALAELQIIRVSDQLLSWIETVKREEAPEKIFQAAYDRIVFEEMRGKLHLYLVKEAINHDETLKIKFREKYLQWRKVIEETLAKFLHVDTDFKVFAQIILAALDGFIIQSLLGVEGNSSEEIAGFVLGGC